MPLHPLSDVPVTSPDDAARPQESPAREGPQGTSPAVAAFASALRAHFPSREALLAEARAQTQARRRRVGTTAVLTLATCLIGTLAWRNPVLGTQVLRTGIGEQRIHTLPDGSTVALNTGTTVTTAYRLLSRELWLEQGEAAFSVATGWRSFVVHSGAAQVRDIGTVFMVRRLPEGSRVTVLEGEVEVARRLPDGTLEVPGLRLHTRQRVDVPDTLQQAVSAVDTVNVTDVQAWRQGRLVFSNTALSDVIAEIQRYRKGEIRLGDASLATLRLSGVYDARDVEALLDALPRALPIVVRRDAEGQVLIQAPRAEGTRSRSSQK